MDHRVDVSNVLVQLPHELRDASSGVGPNGRLAIDNRSVLLLVRLPLEEHSDRKTQ